MDQNTTTRHPDATVPALAPSSGAALGAAPVSASGAERDPAPVPASGAERVPAPVPASGAERDSAPVPASGATLGAATGVPPVPATDATTAAGRDLPTDTAPAPALASDAACDPFAPGAPVAPAPVAPAPVPPVTPLPASAPVPPPRPAFALRRSRTDRMLGGVCGGLAAGLGVDAALLRVGLVVLTVFGFGLGAVFYAAAWYLAPEDDAPR